MWCYNDNFNVKLCREDASKCLKQFTEPVSVTHSFVTTKSNVESGKLYEVTGLERSGYHYKFLIRRVGVELRVDEELSPQQMAHLERDFKFDHLKLERDGSNAATLFLVKPILGPRQFTVEIDVLSRDQRHLGVLHRSLVHVFVSEYDGKNFTL